MDSRAIDRRRVAIEGVSPQVDGGRFAIKRLMGDEVVIGCDAFADGHEVLVTLFQHRHGSEKEWHEQPMSPLGNDRWQAAFRLEKLGIYRFRIISWVDHFRTWRAELVKRAEAKQKLHVELLIGAEIIEAAIKRASTAETSSARSDAAALTDFMVRVKGKKTAAAPDERDRYATAMDERVLSLMDAHADRDAASTSAEYVIVVDDERAAFSAWYELFPRSYSPTPGKHGTLRDLINHLPYVASMGFDVLYLPPIHPVGQAFRKGKNNRETAESGDVGSPWAIGAKEGGHKAIHPELGTLDDFRALTVAARGQQLEVALDIAFQCSPEHPYVRDHPGWFRGRPDGTIQYAENPPKKYQDIYPFDFDCEDWRGLWEELKSVFLFWAQQGVRIFRVDNPHTKPFAFWEWCIGEVKAVQPDAIFLSEAFTRPKIMYRLAKLGFTQSYTYFTWRNHKQELTEYFTELSQPPVSDIFRPNLFTNTPDILHEYLQHGGRPAFMARAVLAATLGANWGVYGAAFELIERTPREPGSEEYLNSEKYELKRWDLNSANSLRDLLARLNIIRRANRALQRNSRISFHRIESDQLIAYSKSTPDLSKIVLTVVNLDPHQPHSGWLELPLEQFRLGGGFDVVDLLSGRKFHWDGPRAYIELDPQAMPAHIFQIRG